MNRLNLFILYTTIPILHYCYNNNNKIELAIEEGREECRISLYHTKQGTIFCHYVTK
jgi:hypothetical protein